KEIKSIITASNVTLRQKTAQGLPHDDGDSSRPTFAQNDTAEKIVAIGEIGLDYYWVKEPEKRAFQQEAMKKQLKLAEEVNKPVIIHMREENDAWFGQASVDLLNILSEWHQELHAQDHPL